jgi:DNA-directed RNA polymerase subunit RPC12/RpoP
MSKSQESGDAGELDVIEKVPCPNCGKRLMGLPKNYPLYDVQCVGCNFRAQVKTNNSKLKREIFGAGWDIMEKVLKSGFITPPLITNFIWKDRLGIHQEIRFYPFIPKKNLKMHKLSPTARRANYKMFNYIGIDILPYFVLFVN